MKGLTLCDVIMRLKYGFDFIMIGVGDFGSVLINKKDV